MINQWISVEERLPEMYPDDRFGSITYSSADCIVLDEGGEVMKAKLGRDAPPREQTPYWYGSGAENIAVTHWMPFVPPQS